ncbi:membrane protein [Arthrobacter phage Snek]
MTSREPLVIRAAIVAAITAVIHVLVVLGVLPILPEAETAVAGAVDLIGTAVLVVWTRGKVTPVADPKLPAPAPELLPPAVPAVAPLPAPTSGVVDVDPAPVSVERPAHRAE